jgi:hypothetical protein
MFLVRLARRPLSVARTSSAPRVASCVFSSVEADLKRSTNVILPPSILSENPLGDSSADINKFFEISGGGALVEVMFFVATELTNQPHLFLLRGVFLHILSVRSRRWG